MISAQSLYETVPDRIYVGPNAEEWYAFYDDDFAILTNAADNRLKVYQYDNKGEYRDVRRTIVDQYALRQIPVETDYD